jgi:asparagine synthase (glutamine-hydrolysing)
MRTDDKGGKRILRDVLARYLPPALTERPKQGFSVPIAAWLRGPLKDWAEDYLAEDRLARQGLFDPGEIRRLWDQHRRGWRNHTKLIWAVLVFQMWTDEYA